MEGKKTMFERFRAWLLERLYRRKLRRLTYKPTFFAQSVMLYEYKLKNIDSDWFLCMDADDMQLLLPVNKEIIHGLVQDLSDAVGLSFVEFE